jgi:hypothetical protein
MAEGEQLMGSENRTSGTLRPDVPGTSARLQRAASAERRALERKRDRLTGRRDTLLAELEPIERALGEIDERVQLLQRLIGDMPAANGSPSATSAGEKLLRGPAIREAAVITLLAQPQPIDALHYRDWYELVQRARYTVAGADPLAVFLTQLTRSPVVRRSTQSGVYALDRAAPQRLRGELDRLEQELRETTMRSDTTGLASSRARRRELQLAIDRHERALKEALRALALAEVDDSRRRPGPSHRDGAPGIREQPSPAGAAGTLINGEGDATSSEQS